MNGTVPSLRDYVAAFFHRLEIFVICLVLTPVVAVGITLVMPKVYQGSTKIWAKEQRPRDPFEVEARRLSFLKDQQELILSNEVAMRVLAAMSKDNPVLLRGQEWEKLNETQKAAAVDRLRKKVEAEIDVGTMEGGSSFILLKVKAGTAADAARVTNLYAEKYTDYYYELGRRTAHGSYVFLESRLKQMSETLQASEDKLRDFEMRLGGKLVPLIELIKQGSSSSFSEAYKFIGANDLFQADFGEKAKGFELIEQAQKDWKGLFIPEDSSSKNLSLIHLRDNLVNLQLKLSHIKQRRTEMYDDVGMLGNEVTYAENLLKSQITEDLQSRMINNQASRQKLDMMETRVQEIRSDFADIAKNKVSYERLHREVENNAAIYKTVQQELESARTAAELNIHRAAGIYVVDRAIPPLKPVSPKLWLNLLLGVFAGLIIGIGVVTVHAYLDHTIKTPEQVTALFGLDVLGSVSMPKEPRRSWRFWKPRRFS